MKITFYPPQRTVSLMRPLIVYLVLACLAGANAVSLEEKMRDVTKEIESLWSENSCETVVIKKNGYPLASVACSGSFGAELRTKFLDVLFRHRFVLEKEIYRLQPQNGTYLYKTGYADSTVYFKLYVRDAADLWPRNPVTGKQVAVHVQNLHSAGDLVRWRTLGIPLTFSVTYGRVDTREILAKLGEYNEEKWLALALEDDRVDIADGNMLSIAEALDREKLGNYLAAAQEGVDGISPLYCSRFCRNVPALRALIGTLREMNRERPLILLDTENATASSFYETGRIMGMRTFRTDRELGENGQFCRQLSRFLNSPAGNASRIFSVDAADKDAFRCLRRVTRAAARVQFMRVSQMSPTDSSR